jgi:hypothetical protein
MYNEKIQKIIFDLLEYRPSKEVFEKSLLDIISEKNKIIKDVENSKKLMVELDKLIESIQIYLSVASK